MIELCIEIAGVLENCPKATIQPCIVEFARPRVCERLSADHYCVRSLETGAIVYCITEGACVICPTN